MAVDNELFAAIPRLQTWAADKSNIRRMWVFGSRLKGTQSADSDLDVAIEIDAIGTDEETQLIWMDVSHQWDDQLKALAPWKLSKQMYGTPHVDEYLASCSMLIYERAAAPP